MFDRSNHARLSSLNISVFSIRHSLSVVFVGLNRFIWSILFDLKAPQLTVLWAFEMLTCSRFYSLILCKVHLLYVVHFVN
jgi:hypothetical protein